MFTTFKIPTFPSSAQLAERMLDPMAMPHTTGDIKHLDTMPVIVAEFGSVGGCKPECITTIPRRPKLKLAAPNLKPFKPLRAFNEEVEDVDCTRPTPLPQNPEDLNTTSPTFEIPSFPSTTQLPERTIPDTSDAEDHSLAKVDPESYNYKGQDHRSYTEYLDTLRSESWKLKRFKAGWDNCSDAPLLFNTFQAMMVTYDHSFSLGDKATFAKQNGLAGYFFFHDFREGYDA
ncbi:hypothetical protein F5877DRAFT_73466 [Lentinula edodes]|nr:hypothetical protein F5877DRAFT_73466 [Lentinula edodes]